MIFRFPFRTVVRATSLKPNWASQKLVGLGKRTDRSQGFHEFSQQMDRGGQEDWRVQIYPFGDKAPMLEKDDSPGDEKQAGALGG